jgi:2,4-dienoyl-CoA reductase-like NADH-dependent reductase (Old Yellow Enzyme family)
MAAPFDPIRIGSIGIKNRFVRSATWDGMATEEGAVTDKLLDYVEGIAKGGVGLFVSGYASVDPRGRNLPRMLAISSDDFTPGLRDLASRIQRHGIPAVAQIVQAGAQTKPDNIGGENPIGPSSIKDPTSAAVPDEMTIAQIHKTIDAFAQAANRAKEAGFDMVQLHIAHGFLLNQFLSPYSNRRTDEYGGSPEKRQKMILETYRATKDAAGSGFPVLVKLSSDDYFEGGLTEGESFAVACKLVDDGIDAIEVSGGIPASGDLGPARRGIDEPDKEAYFADFAQRLKKEVDVPVILVGGIRSYEVAEGLLEDEKADMIAMSRPLISEPDLISRWREGKTEKARCISCNKCMLAGIKEGGIRCVAFEGQE